MHDVSRRTKLFNIDDAHKGKVSGVCFGQESRLLSCGVDRNIKLWDNHKGFTEGDSEAGPSQVRQETLLPRPFLHQLFSKNPSAYTQEKLLSSESNPSPHEDMTNCMLLVP